MKTKSVLAKLLRNQSLNHSPQPAASPRITSRRLALGFACALAVTLAGCDNKPNTSNSNAETKPVTPTSAPAPASDAAQIIARNRKLDDSRDSSTKLRARIRVDSNAATEVPIPAEVQVTILRKRQADNGQAPLV